MTLLGWAELMTLLRWSELKTLLMYIMRVRHTNLKVFKSPMNYHKEVKHLFNTKNVFQIKLVNKFCKLLNYLFVIVDSDFNLLS